MKATRFYAILAIAAVAVACNKPEGFNEPASLNKNEFKAEMGECVTKVSMDADYSLTWDAQDKVSVFGPDGVNTEFTALSSGATTILEGPADYVIDAQNEYYAIYPYSSNNTIKDGVISTYVESVNTAKVGTFPKNYSVAKSVDGQTLSFYNVCGLMGIKITREDIIKVTFSVSGENEYLAGKIKVNLDNVTEPTYTVVEGTKLLTLMAAGASLEPGDYYVAMLPQEFSAMTVTMYNTDGQVSEVHNLQPFTLNRSHHIAPLPVDGGQFDAEPLSGLPARWTFPDKNGNADYEAAWVNDNRVPSDEGLGYFSYVPGDEPLNENCGRVLGTTGDPYVTGAWPGDYWLYEVPTVVPANTKFSIQFAGRVSGEGQKFWSLEYLDGEQWLPVGKVLSSEETGTLVEYTHAMSTSDQVIKGKFVVTNQMNSLKIRYRCVANWKVSGEAALSRNTYTTRMTGRTDTALEIKVGGEDVMYTEWLFTEEAVVDGTAPYISTFGGLEGDAVTNSEAGDGRCYVAANVSGYGRISYVQVDKESYNSTNPKRYVGSTGHPVVKGVMAGDYWLFEATDDKEYPAGTKLNISFRTRISSAGQKYWMLECWDGARWITAPGYEVQTATIGDETVSYNLMPSTDDTNNSVVDVTWTLAQSCTNMQFRYICVANYNKSGVVTKPGGGTSRIAGAVGTSPIFKVVE